MRQLWVSDGGSNLPSGAHDRSGGALRDPELTERAGQVIEESCLQTDLHMSDGMGRGGGRSRGGWPDAEYRGSQKRGGCRVGGGQIMTVAGSVRVPI